MVKQQYDTYGFKVSSLEEVAVRVQHILTIKLQERDSMYYAGTYYLYEIFYAKELMIFNNYDTLSGSWVREEYRDYNVIMMIASLPDMDVIGEKLINEFGDIVLLSSKFIEGEDKSL